VRGQHSYEHLLCYKGAVRVRALRRNHNGDDTESTASPVYITFCTRCQPGAS